MDYKKLTIVGLLIPNREENAHRVQALLTEFGCQIKTRLGLHEVDENQCSMAGLMLLEMFGDQTKIDDFIAQCQAIDGVQVQSMRFDR